MAENNAAETSMPAFVRAGMDFFSGKTVLKSTFDESVKALETANARIKELEAAAVDAKPLNEKISTLESAVTSKDETIKAHLETISTLEENYKTAARQAQQQIAQAGAAAPVNVEAPKNQDTKEPEFQDRVSGFVKAGMTKAEAIRAAVTKFPAEHLAWLKSGKTSSL